MSSIKRKADPLLVEDPLSKDTKDPSKRARLDPKEDEKKEKTKPDEIGAIVHWGVYAVPAFDSVPSAATRRIQNGSEWYRKRLMSNSNSFRPCSGWRETRAYHDKTYGEKFAYTQFAEEFCKAATTQVIQAQMDKWMDLFKSFGATYAILTAKHHDGFCLFPSKTEDGYEPKPTSRPDWLQLFKDATKKAGLKFGIYYSWGEFSRPATKSYMDEVVTTHIKQLIEYGADIYWFDGDWMCLTNYATKTIDDCVDMIKKNLPQAQINDRIGHKTERDPLPDFLGKATYRVYADRFIPTQKPNVPFEHINTVGLSWGRNRQQTESDCKSVLELQDLKRRILDLGGRFLMNVGPNPDGSLCPIETDRLRRMSSKG